MVEQKILMSIFLFLKRLNARNRRKSLDSLYQTIKDAKAEIELIRNNCPHEEWKLGNYSWRPGNIKEGAFCVACDKYLGKVRTINEWVENFNRDYQEGYGFNNAMNPRDKSLKFEFKSELNRTVTKDEFIKIVDKEIPLPMRSCLYYFFNP